MDFENREDDAAQRGPASSSSRVDSAPQQQPPPLSESPILGFEDLKMFPWLEAGGDEKASSITRGGGGAQVRESNTQLLSLGIGPSIWGYHGIQQHSQQQQHQIGNQPSFEIEEDFSLFSPFSPFIWRDSPDPKPAPPLKKDLEDDFAVRTGPTRLRQSQIQNLPHLGEAGSDQTAKKKQSDHQPSIQVTVKDSPAQFDANSSARSAATLAPAPQAVAESIAAGGDGEKQGRKETEPPSVLMDATNVETQSTWSRVVKVGRLASAKPPPAASSNTTSQQNLEDEVLLFVPKTTWSDLNREANTKGKQVPTIPKDRVKLEVDVDDKKAKPHVSGSQESKGSKPFVHPFRPDLILSYMLPPFFGEANKNPSVIIVGGLQRQTMNTDQLIQDRLSRLKNCANRGYGVVPITNSFTIRNSQTKHISKKAGPKAPVVLYESPPSSPEASENDDSLNNEIITTPNRKQSSKNIAPPSPTLPSGDELKQLILYQVGFASGRQGLFQGVAKSKCGASVASLLGSHVVLHQDDGVDIGILRGLEPIDRLVPRIPEVPFMRVIRRAREGEVSRLELKAREEAYMVQAAQNLLDRQKLVHMKVQYCEFQYDRNKLVVFADMTEWVNFNEFVKSFFITCETEFQYQARIFIQRRFVGSKSAYGTESKHGNNGSRN